jgi:uncharacterized protein (UPF0333 family)
LETSLVIIIIIIVVVVVVVVVIQEKSSKNKKRLWIEFEAESWSIDAFGVNNNDATRQV